MVRVETRTAEMWGRRSPKRGVLPTATVVLAIAVLLFAVPVLHCTRCEARETGKRIVVSIDDQFAYFIEDGFLVKSHIVSTGTDQNPTPLGVFSINAHEYMTPSTYVVQYYTMYYYQHLAFHSVLYCPSTGTWIGEDTLGQKASHGCIRQTLADAEWAYNWTPDGTRVDIIQEHFVPPPPKPAPIDGGSDLAGATRPSNEWYFAEGCTEPGFNQYLVLMNPGPLPTQANVTFTGSDNARYETAITLGGCSRETLHVNEALEGGHSLSTSVSSDEPIVAERPMYFNYRGVYAGGHVVMGATEPSSIFYFAEGTCRPLYDPYICIQNPGGADAEVIVTYMLGNGTAQAEGIIVPADSRSTLSVKDRLGEGDDPSHDFAARVECVNGQQVVAERSMYFSYRGLYEGGHVVMGATELSSTYYFAEGTCRSGFDPYICVLNPVQRQAVVEITYMKGDGTSDTQKISVAPGSRSTVVVKDRLGEGDDPSHDFAARVDCVNGQPILVERPVYFNYRGIREGGHVVMGATEPSSIFYFAEGTCRPGFDPFITIMNPSNTEALVEITYMKGDGTSDTETLSVAPVSRSTVVVKDRLGEGDDPSHDFAARVYCVNGQQVVAERPTYFRYPGY